jgi:hypothetical protein
MDMNIDLNALLEEIKAMDENDPRKVAARKVVEQGKDKKPASLQEIEEWADNLSKQLSKLTD